MEGHRSQGALDPAGDAAGLARRSTLSATGVLLGIVLPSYLVASLAVLIREDFAFSDVELGLASGGSFAAAALTAPSAGRIVDRIGVQRGIYISGVLIVVSSLAIAALAESALALILLMAVIGFGGGIGSPSVYGLLARDVRLERQGIAFGILTSAPQLGAFVAGLALPLLGQPVGWRAAFGGAAAIIAVCALSVPRNPTYVKPDGTAALSSRATVALASFAAALASASGIGMRFFLVVFAVAVGFSSSDAGLLLALTGLVAIASRIGFGLLGDLRPDGAFVHTSALMAVSAGGFVLMAIESHLVIIAGAVLAGGIGWGWQAPLSLALVKGNPDAPAQAMGLQLAGFLGGAAVGPLLVGVVAHHGTYAAAWLVCCAMITAAAVVTALLARSREVVWAAESAGDRSGR